MTASTGPGHEQWVDASGAYLLGALPDDEAEAYALHLEVCPACRAELDELAPAAAALPASVPPVPVPAAIGERVMAEVRREAQLLAAAGAGADRAPAAGPRRRAWWRWPVPALAVAALLLGLAVGLGAAGVIGGGDAGQTIAMTASGPASGARARLVIDGSATLEADHLPSPGSGRVYQVWLKPAGGAPEPTKSLFVPRADGNATVAVPAEASHMEAVMVTAEPDGGSPQPTSDPVLTATLG